MNTAVAKDGYIRMVYSDAVHWALDRKQPVTRRFTYLVAKFPFVPDYHLCEWVEDYYNSGVMLPHVCERPLQQFKTLAQALAVLKVIEGSQT
jgi:hypothetical protein